MKKPIRVAVTGAAGQIGYSLLFRIASGEMLGKDQPVILQLLEIPDEKAQKALKGVMMELDDCAFPLLHGMVADRRSHGGVQGRRGSRCWSARARAARAWSARTCSRRTARSSRRRARRSTRSPAGDVKVLVVGNPANTNCLIAMKNAPSLKPTQFTAMMRLDHNRAVSQIAQKTGKPRRLGAQDDHLGQPFGDAVPRRRSTPSARARTSGR